MVAFDRVLAMGQIELFDIQAVNKQMTYVRINLEIELFDHLTVGINDCCLIELVVIHSNHLIICKRMSNISIT